MKNASSLVLAALVTLAGYAALGGPLTLPAFHDGMAAPKTIAVVVARPHGVASNIIGIR